ncbi:MAG: TonB-dependent receptor plug domain-containing protein, partial [Calditrichaeota bacterium]|nr:TonB-dependent receptor plug domain-containing protein [Calditrichota bacterium]
TSTRSLSYEEVRRAPGSAEDVQRAIQALPGIAASNDQTNEIIVRGGSPTENLLIVDGIEIDNINHFPEQASSGGPIGLINPEFLREVTFASGGFSARYGDRLSSVLDLNLREGSRERFMGQLALSMAGVGANCEGGFADKRGSYLISFRKSYLEAIKDAIDLTATPKYWDTQFKIAYDLSPLDKLSLIGIYGDDKIEIEQEDADAWSRGAEAFKATGSTSALGGKWRKVGGNGYSNLILAMTEINYRYDVYDIDKDADNNVTKRQYYEAVSTETTNQIHLDRTQKLRDTDELCFGFSLKPIIFSHDFMLEEDSTAYDINADGITDTIVYRPVMDIEESTTSTKYGGFMQYRWRPLNNLTIIGGLRMDGFQYSDELTIAPRLSAIWEIKPRLTLKSAWGIYHQSHPLLIYTSDPSGANKDLPHSKAVQYVLGISYLLTDATLLTIEGYYKDYENLAVSEQSLLHNVNPLFRSWRYRAVGTKESWGLEVFAQQKFATNWYGTFSYSYGGSEFNDSQKSYPSDYDYRHISTLSLGYKFNGFRMRDFQKKWYWRWTYVLPVNGDELTISSRFRYVSGRPYTPKEWTTNGWEVDPHWEDVTGEKNSARYPDYVRWDIRWDSKWFFGHRSVIVFLEVQNLLDRKNVAEYIYADDEKIDTVYQWRFFFVGGVRFEF